MRTRILITSLLVVGLIGCASDDDDDSGPNPNPTRAFKTDQLPAGAALYLHQKELSASTLVLELAGKNLADGYGIAYRLEYDPAVLGFALATSGTVWTPHHVQITREARPGLLLGAVTEKGNVVGSNWQDTTLVTLSFDVRSSSAGRVDFINPRSGVIHGDGRQDAVVKLVGGELSAE